MKKKVFLIPLAMFMVTGTVGLAACDTVEREEPTQPADDTKTLVGIAVDTPPTKTVYTDGDSFDPTGLKIKASYTDGTSEIVDGWTVDKTQLAVGDNVVTITYTKGTVTLTTTVSITVNPKVDPGTKTLAGIAVTTQPTKTHYDVGEVFDKAGMVVTASYSNSDTADVTEHVTTDKDGVPLTADDKVITVSYTEDGLTFTDTVNITVGDEPGPDAPEHAGTIEDPYTTSDAKIVCDGLQGQTSGMVYVEGIVAATPAPKQEGQNDNKGVTFYTTDGKTSVQNYFVKGIGGVALDVSEIEAGDHVVVQGVIKDYNGTVEICWVRDEISCELVEHSKPTPADIVSVDGIVQEGLPTQVKVGESIDKNSIWLNVTYSNGNHGLVNPDTITFDNTEAATGVVVSCVYGTFDPVTFTINVIEKGSGHAGTLEDPLTTAEAATIANGLAETTDSKNPIASEGMYVKGVVTKFEETFSADFGNYSIVIGGDFTLWRIKNGPEFAKFNAGDIEVGDEVTAFVYIMNFKGTPESTSKSYVHSVQKAGDTKTLQSIEIVGSLTKTSYVEGQTYSSAGLSVKGHYDDGSEGDVAATITLNKTTAALGDTEIIASATFKEITAEPKTFAVTVTEKVPVVGGSVYTFKNDKTQAQNIGTWTSEQFMKCVEVDGGEIITGMKNATNAYIGGNGGSGDTAWNIWDCLKVGKSNAKGEITLLLDGTASFSKIKVSVIGARDDGTLTINEITQNVTKKATKDDLEPIELEYEITGGITELKLSSKDAASNNYGIVITRIEFVDEGPKVPVLSSLELTKSPDKVDYHAGEEFDPTGMVITAKYTNGGADKVLQSSDYSIDKTTLALGDEYVIVSYTEDDVTKTVQVPITVTKAPVPVTGITLDQSTLSMHVLDADVQLVATVAPEDADDKTVTWTVSKQGIVTVSNGLVHALAAGEVTVTATAGDFSATCVVTVAAAEKVISGIAVATQPSKTTYVEGESFDPSGMTITVSYSSPHEPEIISSGFTYSTDPLTTGTNSVVITYNGFTANVSVTVTPAPVLDSISVANAEGKTNTYTVGAVISKDDLVVTAHYTQGKQDAVVTDYTISKTTALAVTDTSVTISYTEGGIEKTATYSFTVTKPTEPQIDVSNVDLYSIDAASLGLGSYADGTNTDLAWTMLCKGNSDTLQGNSSKSSELHNKIAFSKNITYIKFNVGYAAGDASTGSVRFGSSATPTGNDTSYGANTDLSLVTVGSFNVSAPAECNYFSVVWTKGASYFSSIEIHFEEMGEQEQVAVQSVSLNKTSTSISVGSNETLVATVAPSNANDKSVTWSSSDSSIATVDSTGKVAGIAQGTATITVTTVDGSKTATCTVTVTSEGGGGGSETTSTPIDLGGDSEVVFGGVTYKKSIKAGTGKVAGSASISVPSDAKKLVVYIAGWNGESVKVSASGNGLTSKTLTLTSDSGVSGNGPTYTIGSTTESSFKFEIDVSSLTGGTLSLAATSGKRFVVWNASYTK